MLNHNETRIIAKAEREVLKVLEGDCDTAVGVYAKVIENKIDLTAELFSVDGKQRYFIKKTIDKERIIDISKEVGEQLKLSSKGSYKN